jgi:hypothetical protein
MEREGDPFDGMNADLRSPLKRAEDSTWDRVTHDEVFDLQEHLAVRVRRVSHDAATTA